MTTDTTGRYAPMPEKWVVVRETTLDVGLGADVRTGGRPELGYALISDAATFDSSDDAAAAIRSAGLPVGWVYMQLSRLLPDLYKRDSADATHALRAAQRPADINGLTATDVVSQNIVNMSSKAAEKDANCPRCNGSGTVAGTTSHLGPDDYDFEAACPACAGTGSANLKDAINALPYMEHRDSVPRNAHPYIVVERSKVLRLIDAALASRPVPPPTVTQESIFDELYEMGQHLTDALARIKELEDELSSMKRNNEMLLKHMDKLGAERDALKVDAERYRWLRDESREMPDGQRELYAVAHRLPLTEDSNESLFDGALDAAIDAAMKESGQ